MNKDNFKQKGKTGSLKNRLVKSAAGTFGLRLAYTALTFITSILLARLLGTSGFGIYTYTVTWAYLLSTPATLGWDNLLVREIAIYQTQSAWGLMRGLLVAANRIVLLVSVGLALFAALIAWLLGMGANSEVLLAFCVAMVSIPIGSLRNLRRGAMRGLDKTAMGFLPEMLIAPLLLIALTGCAYLLLKEGLRAPTVVGIYGVVTAITLVISWKLLDATLPNAVGKAIPKYQVGVWMRSALPFMFLGSIYIINARIDFLMLGAIQGVEATGLYVPVNRGAQLIAFILMAVNNVLAPTIASFYKEGKKKELQKIITKTARGVFLISFAFAASLIVFGHWYLLLFGSEFTQGQTALTILCIGQLLNNATGLAGGLLNMTGYERFTAINGAVTSGLNVMLNALLIRQWGVEGAAIATVSSIILMNIVNIIWLKKNLGIHSTCFFI